MPPKRRQLLGFWACSLDIAKCYGCNVRELEQTTLDEAWASLSEEERASYKELAKDCNVRWGRDAIEEFKKVLYYFNSE